ncbi:MAG: hypothetical protein SFY96_10420 [Planctomycetota bacterium]|nr:hypothetical protein [Planctomycetota bacterium]
MAKMFYSLEEAAAKLGKSVDEVKSMADNRQLEVFRDRDRLMFKVEQVDLLSGGGDDVIPLAGDSAELEPISLASSGSSIALENPKESTGISIFDADATDESDPSAVTRVSQSIAPIADPGSSRGGSGAGGSAVGGSSIGDMTRAEDTGIGGSLLDDVYGQGSADASADQDAFATSPGASLFEGTSVAADDAGAAGAAMVPMVAEVYDGPGSGLVGGLAFGVVVTLLVAVFAVIVSTTTTNASVLATLGENVYAVLGGLAGLIAIGGGLGWFLGKKS